VLPSFVEVPEDPKAGLLVGFQGAAIHYSGGQPDSWGSLRSPLGEELGEGFGADAAPEQGRLSDQNVHVDEARRQITEAGRREILGRGSLPA